MMFVDMFAGIGGMRLAFEQAGHECIWSCECDKFARRTYAANFGEEPEGSDIMLVPSDAIPDHDLLVAGFPCQTFSKIGHRKGFDDPRGLLYRELLRIVADKRPLGFLFENVVGIMRYLDVIASDFWRLGYSFNWSKINSSLVWPQSRPRIFMAGWRSGEPFEFPVIPQRSCLNARALLEEVDGPRWSDITWAWLQGRKARYPTGTFSYRVLGDVCPTLRCSKKDYIVIPMPSGNPRYLTLRERARLQGFPDSFAFPVSETQAIKQLGNTVTIPLVRELASAIKPTVCDA